MNPFFITVICIVILAAVVAVIYFVMENKKSNGITYKKGQSPIIVNNTELADAGKAEMIIQFDNLPSLTEEEENRLIEINDNKLLARIDGVIPGTLQALANVGGILNYQKSRYGRCCARILSRSEWD